MTTNTYTAPIILFKPIHILLLLTLFAFLYFKQHLPSFDQLTKSQVTITEYQIDPVNSKVIVHFSGNDGLRFECTTKTYKKQKAEICSPNLKTAYQNGDNLLVAYKKAKIYQIQDGTIYLLDYADVKWKYYLDLIVSYILITAVYTLVSISIGIVQMAKSKPISTSEPIQRLNTQNRVPNSRLLFYIAVISSVYYIFSLNTDIRELFHEMNTSPTASKSNPPVYVAKPIQIVKDSVIQSQPTVIAIPSLDSSPTVIGNSTDMFSWVGGINQEVKNSCLSPSNRQLGGSVESGTSNTRIQAEGVWCFFDNTTQLYEIRMDAPFAGSVAGIHIGDPSNRLNVLGAPDRQIALTPGKPESLFYKLGSAYTLRIERDNANMIETMLIIK